MAIAELSQDAVLTPPATESGGSVRLGVHDASRLEWSLSLPLPESPEAASYTLRVCLQIPLNSFVRHVPWDQMQAFTRLDGPAGGKPGDAVTIDALRRGALATANELVGANDAFVRQCRRAVGHRTNGALSATRDALEEWLREAETIAHEARERFGRGTMGEPSEVTRERELVDEYVSVRFLEMLAGAERALLHLQEADTKARGASSLVVAVSETIAQTLSREVAYREAKGYSKADPSSPHALEHYLERASQLKKHFQEVLFLEQETFHVADRAYHWIAAFVAVLASTWAFVWQIALINTANTATTVSSGVVAIALVAGLVYAGKDRIKEIGRDWMTHRVQRVWGAQRVSRYRAPARRIASRDVVVTARESFNQLTKTLPDPLNPECGALTAITELSYEHHGELLPNAQLIRSGVRRVKHVFRYDLSPIFSRLDDATKPVPVLDEATHRVRFVDAPRCYRVPVSVEVVTVSGTRTEKATLVLHKRGLERIDRDEDSHPSLSEVGIEPG